MNYIQYLLIVLFALCVNRAHGQYIELSFNVTVERGSYTHVGVASLVFDTDAVPTLTDFGRVVFVPVSGRYTYHLGYPSPFAVVGEESDEYVSSELIFNPDDQSLWIDIQSTGGDVSGLEVYISPISDSFFADMTSLPDDPSEYGMQNAFVDQTMFALMGDGNAAGTSTWTAGNGGGFRSGSLSYTARLIEELEPEPCSPADINGDGIINFFDVSEYLRIFQMGCP